MLEKLFKTSTGKIIVSILLGLGLSALFQQACANRDCIIIKAPDLNTVVSNIFKYNDECYKFKVENTKCQGSVIY